MIEKIKNLCEKRMWYLYENKNNFFKWNETFFIEILKEIEEAKAEVKEKNSVYLEDELWDIFWDYLCLLETLKKEWKIESIENVFKRCYKKFSWRINEETWESRDWQEVKKFQKEELKNEHFEKYWEQKNI